MAILFKNFKNGISKKDSIKLVKSQSFLDYFTSFSHTQVNLLLISNTSIYSISKNNNFRLGLPLK